MDDVNVSTLAESAEVLNPHVTVLVQTITSVACLLSIVGSILIIITFIAWKDLRTRPREILVYLSIADFLTSLGYLYGTLENFEQNSWNCIAQSAVTTFANMSSFFWTVSIAVYLYILIVKMNTKSANQAVVGFHIVNWGVPFLIVVFGVALDGLGWDANYVSVGWCWINIESDYVLLWMLIAGKIWEVLSYVILPMVYFMIKQHIHLQASRFHELPRRAQANVDLMVRVDAKMTAIPLVYILLRVWGTTRFFLHLASSPASSNTLLIILHGVGNTSQGAANCILFCLLTKKVRDRLFVQSCCSSESRRPSTHDLDTSEEEEEDWHERTGLLSDIRHPARYSR